MGNGLCSGNGLFVDNQPTATAVASAGANERPSSHIGFPPDSATVPNGPEPSLVAPGATPRAAGSEAARTAAPAPADSPVTEPHCPRVPFMASSAGDRKAAEDLKAAGNALFSKGKYSAAIERYTEAITLCPEWAVLYVNRGMAARKRCDWERVEADAGAALGMGPGERDAMKGHYLLGLAMGARGQHERSTHHLRKALDAAREANDSIKDEIWRELAAAKYQQWQVESAARRAQGKALRRQLAGLLGLPGGPDAPPEEEPQLPAEWAALFSAVAWKDVAAEAPSQFTCPLTMEIFRDPVVVPSGRSYERSALLEHLKKVGHFDPITRQQLTEEQLVPNVSLRAAIELYLEEHPWGWGEVK